jgi:hypothetical protein
VTVFDPAQGIAQRDRLFDGLKSMVACNKAFSHEAPQVFAQMRGQLEGT